jgi:hypothetical protein
MWGRKRSDGDQKPPTAPSTPASASAVSRVNSDAIRSAVPEDKKPHGLAPGPDKGGEHCFSQLDATTFQVRGPRYLHDKAKVPAGPSIFDLMHVDVFLSNDKIGNVAARKDSWLRAARDAGDPRYYLVILYVTPAAPFIHLIMYYAVNEERLEGLPHAAKLWKAFTAHGPEADDFRNDRWKVIPRVAEGSWVVQKAVGAKPALLAQKLTHTWVINDGLSDDAGASSSAASAPAPAPAGAATTSLGCDANLPHSGARVRGGSVVSTTGPGPYLEADCDVASSNMAFVLVSLLQQYAKYIVIDLGFAIEPRADDECPEVVLGSVRLSRIDVTKPPLVAADAGDMILGSVGVTHGDDDEDGDDGSGGEGGSGDEGGAGAGSDGDGK